MAAFDTTRTAYGTTSAVDTIKSFISARIADVIAWNDARITRNALSALSDRELEDIGLIRGDIDVATLSNLKR